MGKRAAPVLLGLFVAAALAGCLQDAPPPSSPYVPPADSASCAGLPLPALPQQLTLTSDGESLEATLRENATILGTDGALTDALAYSIGITAQAGRAPLAEPLQAQIIPLEDTLLSQIRLPTDVGPGLTPVWQTLGMDLRDGILIGPPISLGLAVLLRDWQPLPDCTFALALPNGTALEAVSNDEASWEVTVPDSLLTITVTASLDTSPKRNLSPNLDGYPVRDLAVHADGPTSVHTPDFSGTPFAANWSALVAQHGVFLATRVDSSFMFPSSFYCCAELTDGAYDFVRRTGTERGTWVVMDRAVSGTGDDSRRSSYVEHAVEGANAFVPGTVPQDPSPPVAWTVPDRFVDLAELYRVAPGLLDHVSFTRILPNSWNTLHVELLWASPLHDRYLLIAADAESGQIIFTAAMPEGSFENAWTMPTFLPRPGSA